MHLHNHTAYSLLDGATKIDTLVKRAKELGMPAVAITDHGVMYGAVDFYKACKKEGIKPIIGCEVYVAPHSRFDKRPNIDDSPYHLVLLVKNEVGYHNLVKLVSDGSLEGFYYKPRVDRELLANHSEGLVALSACLAGEVPQKIMKDDYEGAKEAARWYHNLFGEENYFLEVQNHGIYEQVKVNQQVAKIGQELGIPLVATNDNHYVYAEDAKTQDVMMCIQMGKTLDDASRMKFEGNHFYLKSYDEMHQVLGEFPGALDNTVKIAQMCDFDFTFGENHMPIFEIPEGYTLEGYLEALCQEELKHRYQNPSEEAYRRLAYELKTINQMGYAGYFLIVWDFIRFAREQRIYVGPGRGSAAGSLVSYCLRITDIDPLKYDLLFERFLNPERISMPDIDIDFCYERRGEIIDYVIEKYGQDRVAQIITFGTMAAKGAIRDVGRVMNVPIFTVNKVAKMIPGELGMTIQKAINSSNELQGIMASDPQIKELIETAQKLEGMPRHAGTHAAGVVISQERLDYYLPLQKTNEGGITTQFAKENVEEIGLLKMDLLGLRTLTVINKAVDLVFADSGEIIDFDQVDVDDPMAYELLCRGDSIGVFQLESAGLRSILKELKPNNLEEIIALVALYRPGPLGSGMVEDFIERKHGRKEIEYLHPLLTPILRPTYGVILYQEQVMRVASDLAGFSLGEADLLRRAMGKKKPEIIAGLKQQFIEGATKNAIAAQTAEKIFELIAYFAGYGFNKSHSAAYAVVAFQTAYLKAHYPVAFMAALLTSVMDTTDRVSFYIAECRKMGINVLPPDVNESRENFQVVGGGIRFGLAAIKNVGKGAIASILEARNDEGRFKGLQDFCARVDLSQVNKRVLENLIKGGAFSSTEGNRMQLLSILDACIEQGNEMRKTLNSNQMSLFDFPDLSGLTRDFAPIPMADLPEFSHQEVLSMEKQILGLYVSGHPLDEYQQLFMTRTSMQIGDLTEEMDEERMTIGGIINHVKLSTTKRGEMMAYVQLEDLTGELEVLIFPKVLDQYRGFIEQEKLVLIKGRLNTQDDEPKFFAESVSALLEPAKEKSSNLLHVAKSREMAFYLKLAGAHNDPALEDEIKQILLRFRGEFPVFFYYPEQKKMVLAEAHFWVANNVALVMALTDLLGAENLSIKRKEGEV